MHGAGTGEGLFWAAAAASNCNRDAAVDKRIRGTWRGDGTARMPRSVGSGRQSTALGSETGWRHQHKQARQPGETKSGNSGQRVCWEALAGSEAEGDGELQSPCHGLLQASYAPVLWGEQRECTCSISMLRAPAGPHVMAHCPVAGELFWKAFRQACSQWRGAWWWVVSQRPQIALGCDVCTTTQQLLGTRSLPRRPWRPHGDRAQSGNTVFSITRIPRGVAGAAGAPKHPGAIPPE
jgi:hypothetical protein